MNENDTILLPLAPRKEEFNPTCSECGAYFGKPQSMRMHKIRKHSGKNWDTSQNFRKGRGRAKPRYPSSDPRYKKAHYKRTVKRYKALGLNAHGEPYKRNGSAPMEPPQPTDSAGEAARAILMAAQVIRSVNAGLRIGAR